MQKELPDAGAKFFAYWRFSIRWLAPVAVGLIIVTGLASTFGFDLPFLN